jgi:hypothetical protein
MLDWRQNQQQLTENLQAMERRRAEKAAEEAAKAAAAKAAREARFLELGMKFEAHRNAGERYPALTPEEFAEAGDLLGGSEAWNELDENSEGMIWRANAIKAFMDAIKASRGTSGTTAAVVNPHAPIVDAVFEAHALREGR